ncbi:deoxycytidine triphosphate deaminase, partial [mine drainage metagenome]
RIYAGMPIGQLIYFEISGHVERSYADKKSAKYRTVSSRPTPSRMYLNFRTRARATGRDRKPPKGHTARTAGSGDRSPRTR